MQVGVKWKVFKKNGKRGINEIESYTKTKGFPNFTLYRFSTKSSFTQVLPSKFQLSL